MCKELLDYIGPVATAELVPETIRLRKDTKRAPRKQGTTDHLMEVDSDNDNRDPEGTR